MFEDIQFHLVASPQLNAFTTGGKHVYLYSELLERCESEDAFAAVVGHEFGHIVGRHVHDSMNNQLLAGLAAAGVTAGTAVLSPEEDRGRNTAVAGTAAGLGATGAITYFSRDNEREADALGFRFYVRAGYEPEQFPEFFKELIAESGGAGGGDLTGFFSTHPNLADRVEAAEARAAEIAPATAEKFARPPIAPPAEFARLQGESRPLTLAAARTPPQEGTALAEAQRILALFPSCLAPDEAGQPGAGR